MSGLFEIAMPDHCDGPAKALPPLAELERGKHVDRD